MDKVIKYQGKTCTAEEIDEIRNIIETYPDKSRWFISRQVCLRWNWTQQNGVLKDMTCRGLLLRLQSEGLIELPPRRQNPPNPLLNPKRPRLIEVERTPITCSLSRLRPIELIQVRRTHFEGLYRSLIDQYHYLGYTKPVGEHLEYIAFCEGRAVSCIGFCSAPRHIGCRDRYIGWDKQKRRKNIHLLLINTRFLILPWVKVCHLASHLLGMMAKRIPSDWQSIYNHDVVFLETFIDPQRGFNGTCYKAANWIYLGKTTGRGKDDKTHKANRSLKLVFGYPLREDFREVLCD
jgi:hypothetical protein